MTKLNKFLFASIASILLISNFAFAQSVDAAGYCPSIGGTIQRGSTGSQVKELQKFFADYYDLNDSTLPVSGVFGKITQSYVMQFQKENNLNPFGIVGAMTRVKIYSKCSTAEGYSSERTSNDVTNYATGDYDVKYADFNFDGLTDKVVTDKNLNDAYRGFIHKDIYVQTTSGNYILSEELTKLINGTGSFTINTNRKMLITYGSGSCCTHYGSEYIVVPNVGLKIVYKISEEEGQQGGVADGKIKVVVEYLVNYDLGNGKIGTGEWRKDTQIVDQATYKYFNGQNSTSAPTTVSVSGMLKFNDSDLSGSNFGFSFWYPSTWGVSYVGAVNPSPYQGGKVVAKYKVTNDYGKGPKGVTVEEFTSDNLSISDATGVGPCPVCEKVTYSFDTNLHAWLLNAKAISNVDANNSMGGLHVFGGSKRFGGNAIIPLSAKNFLVVTSLDSNSEINERNLANTILAKDPSVATPVSVSQQQTTVQAERKAYLGY